ncbi:MAG TPA: tetratricopeptide repeat protein [Verrucomicrobiae bacterium]|nr:tetratricopeptide repeat protein [Verrucomicrobiae bacterium]
MGNDGNGKALRDLLPVFVLLTTGIVFLPAIHNDFVTWDDNAALAGNLNYRGLGMTELRWMFTTFFMGHYQPLAWLTFGGDYILWGLNPLGYHLTNVVLHAANAALFYFVALRLLALSKIDENRWRLRSGACVAALFFALHPLRVESVAWATERRDVLSGLFFLAAIIAYLKAATSEAEAAYSKWIAVALVAYLLSLLSKATGMTLPVVLVILDFFPLKRVGWSADGWFGKAARKVWIEKLPFAVLAGAAAVTAVMAQYLSGAMKTVAGHGPLQRVAQASFGLLYYLGKTFFPARVYPMYDLPRDFSPWEPVYVGSFLVVVAITAVLFVARRRRPALFAAWIYYTALIAPVAGIAQSGSQIVADRYSYLSCLSWSLLVGAGAIYAWRRYFRQNGFARWAAPLAAGVVLVMLGLLTQRQIAVWRDSETLYRYVLAYTPRPSKTAFNNFAGLLAEDGRFDEAIAYYQRALEIDPRFDDARSNLGNALAAQGKTEEAFAQYREALRLNPNSLITHHNFALTLARHGRIDEAIEHYRKALEIEPRFLEGHNNLGLLLAAKGRYGEAIDHYRKALEIDPTFPLAHVNLGDVLIAEGHRQEAIEHFQKALEFEPDLASARSSLAKALAAEERSGAAAGR